MKTIKYLLAGVCAQVVCAGALQAAPFTYTFSGQLGYMQDNNVWGSPRVYPDGLQIGSSYTATMTILNDDLSALNGVVDVDFSGLYQVHSTLHGSVFVCKPGECVHDYDDPMYPQLSSISLSGGSYLPGGSTSLPLSPLGSNQWSFEIWLGLAANTPKPAVDTPLSELPIERVDIDFMSSFFDYVRIDCPGCVEGYTYQYVSQGYQLGGTSNSISEVPVPAAAWLFGTGLAGLAGMARCRDATARR